MRKRWTAKIEVTDSLLKFREKRKWQIALRRYVLGKNPSSFYASYFGLDIVTFRKWIEIQFDGDLTWDNFSTAWQLDHIVPVAYFDFSDDEDLTLCWNFTNIRVEKNELNTNRGNRIDVLAAKAYFENLFFNTRYFVCQKMVKKIGQIELSQITGNLILEKFIQDNKSFIETASSFSSYEFKKLNEGTSFNEIIAERELLKKFGGL